MSEIVYIEWWSLRVCEYCPSWWNRYTSRNTEHVFWRAFKCPATRCSRVQTHQTNNRLICRIVMMRTKNIQNVYMHIQKYLIMWKIPVFVKVKYYIFLVPSFKYNFTIINTCNSTTSDFFFFYIKTILFYILFRSHR